MSQSRSNNITESTEFITNDNDIDESQFHMELKKCGLDDTQIEKIIKYGVPMDQITIETVKLFIEDGKKITDNVLAEIARIRTLSRLRTPK